MSLLSNGKYNQGLSSIPTSRGLNSDGDEDCGRRKIYKTSRNMSNLPCDCLNLIFQRLNTMVDHNSFGLTCRRWFHVQNNSRQSLWFRNPIGANHESFYIVLYKLLIRFPDLKSLFIIGKLPQVTDFVASKPPLFESNVQYLSCHENLDIELNSMFSWFPRLTSINLSSSYITDKGLEVLAKCCSSLEIVNLSGRPSITDTGISFLIQNCRELRLLNVGSCENITGIGFIGCPKTLTCVNAFWCKLTPEGIEAIVSSGGLEHLILCDFPRVGEGSINTEVVVTISKGCPSLKKLELVNCKDVELQGWEAIGLNCRNLELLKVYGCTKLCDLGLQALREGCSKLSRLLVNDANSCSSSAIEIFKRKRPNVMRKGPEVIC